MKLLKYFGKPKKPSIRIRQVIGESMRPTLVPGRIIIAIGPLPVHIGSVVILRHNGMEKIKRIAAIDPFKGVFVLGDNEACSTDSRTFGWIPMHTIIGCVLWPRTKR